MYAAYIITYIKLSPVGVFGGPMVVSMRYIPLDQEWNYCFVKSFIMPLDQDYIRRSDIRPGVHLLLELLKLSNMDHF